MNFNEHVCAVTHVYTDRMLRVASNPTAYIEAGLTQIANTLGHVAICHAARSEYRDEKLPGTVVQFSLWACSPREAKLIQRNIRKRQLQCARHLRDELQTHLAELDRKFREAMEAQQRAGVISWKEFMDALKSNPSQDKHTDHQLRRLDKFIRRLEVG